MSSNMDQSLWLINLKQSFPFSKSFDTHNILHVLKRIEIIFTPVWYKCENAKNNLEISGYY
jgi:hypothetical protein